MMTRSVPIFAAVALFSAAIAAAPAGAAGISPAREFVPDQVVLKFKGAREGKTVDVPPGVGVRQAAAALRRNPRVAYAAPNYIATVSSDSGSKTLAPLDSAIANDPGPLSTPPGPPGGWVSLQWNFLPWEGTGTALLDRKSTRLNSSHTVISYAVFCLKKKRQTYTASVAWSHACRIAHN